MSMLFQSLRGLAAQDGGRERDLRPEVPRRAAGGVAPAAPGGPRPGAARGVRRPLPGRALRRPAAARRPRPRARRGAGDPPPGRAARRTSTPTSARRCGSRSGGSTRPCQITTVYVTHDQAEAMVTSDRIAVMNAGRVEQVGTPVEIYERPATAFVAGFIGRTNLLRGGVGADGRVACEGGLDLADGRRAGAPARGGGLGLDPASHGRRSRAAPGPDAPPAEDALRSTSSRARSPGPPTSATRWTTRWRSRAPPRPCGPRGRRSRASPWARPWSSGSRRAPASSFGEGGRRRGAGRRLPPDLSPRLPPDRVRRHAYSKLIMVCP